MAANGGQQWAAGGGGRQAGAYPKQKSYFARGCSEAARPTTRADNAKQVNEITMIWKNWKTNNILENSEQWNHEPYKSLPTKFYCMWTALDALHKALLESSAKQNEMKQPRHRWKRQSVMLVWHLLHFAGIYFHVSIYRFLHRNLANFIDSYISTSGLREPFQIHKENWSSYT